MGITRLAGKPFIKRIFRRYFILFALLWILLVLYPNPLKLAVSLQRAIDPDIDVAAVESMAEYFPDDPEVIERAVREMVPYQHDWEMYGMPWYFPTTKEVLERGGGDCKGRALVLAAFFEAKNIPYRIDWSPNHVWVEYEGKKETPLENPSVKFYQQNPETGERSLKVPEIAVKTTVDSLWRGFWVAMPGERKALLIVGLLIIVRLRLGLVQRKSNSTLM